MSTPRNSRRALPLAVICLAAIGTATGEAFGEQINILWQTTDSRTASDGDNVTREGTATFANGEKRTLSAMPFTISTPGRAELVR